MIMKFTKKKKLLKLENISKKIKKKQFVKSLKKKIKLKINLNLAS